VKVLLYQWEAYSERGLYKALIEMGHEVVTYSRKIEHHFLDEKFLSELVVLLVQEKVELIMSYDFYPLLAMAGHAAHIKYASWVFGTPHYSLYCDAALYPGNYIFCFDRQQAEMIRTARIENVYHLPLAVDTDMFADSILNNKDNCENDISFVGMMYTGKTNYFEQIKPLPDFLKGFIEGLCEAQLNVYGYNMVADVMKGKMMDEMREYVDFSMEPNFFLTFEQFVIDIINKKITVMERSRTLELLSQYFDVTLYTKADTSHLPKVHNMGYIHYYDKMPSVFHNSKINLNITMRSIYTGIPLRVLDVLGCRGFLLTNYQEEIAEHFEDGKDLAMYSSMDELLDKADYYLKNDDERKRIANNGYEKVKQEFNYKKQLSFIFEKVLE